MKLFYDRYTPRQGAAAFLLLSDLLVIGATAFLASGIVLNEQPVATIMFALWVIAPRIIARP